MVLLRSVLGRRGSFLPTILNVAQLVGWTAFELWVIALTASRIAQMLTQPGTGEMPFWLAVDLVVAMPISWIPLVADYSRFARRTPGAFWGTFAGYALANIWFYALGAMFVLGLSLSEPTPDAIALAIMGMTGGLVALVVILVDETDNVFADIYSSAVSIQNIFPRLNQRWLIVGVTAVSAALAAILTMSQYYDFLLLIGSVFVSLFGVLAADYFVLRRRLYSEAELYGEPAAAGSPSASLPAGFNPAGLAAWLVGIAVYHAVARGLPSLGASIPSFAVTFVVYLLLSQAVRLLWRAPATGG